MDKSNVSIKNKKSNYLITAKSNEGYIIYGMASRSMVILGEREYIKFKSILESPNEIIDEDFHESMKELGFLIPEDKDELKYVRTMYWRTCHTKRNLNLTILPTLKCNMRCAYCYQNGFEPVSMEKKCFEWIIDFISREIKHLEQVNISWFGGEPLLCIDNITHFNKKLKKLCEDYSVELYISMSSNILNLDEDMQLLLVESGINHIETTLAGTREKHNELRRQTNGTNTFDAIIRNLNGIAKHVRVIVSIDLTTTNIDTCEDLLNFMKTLKNHKNIYFVFNRVESHKSNECDELCLNIDTFNSNAINLYNYCLDIGLNICDPTNFDNKFIYCPANMMHSYTISPTGQVYTCCEDYNDEASVGYIGEGGNLVINNHHFNVRDPYSIPKCIDCEILPYCCGGCLNLESKDKTHCPTEKDFLSDYLLIYYRKKFSKNENKS